MKYAKPHLTYQDQVRKLAERGMDVADEGTAVAALKRIGYYRLSAYTYVFRLPGQPSGSSRRSDEFVAGATLKNAVDLYDFDHRLRRTLMDGLQQLEVGLRVKVGYRLGARSPLAHLDPSHLDAVRCARATSASDPSSPTVFEAWREEYLNLLHKAANEDFVKHFIANYDGEVPIWAACEVMTMGCLISLYQLMGRTDRKRIAEELGVKDPAVLDGWLRALNVERNHCAHNSRIWNRGTIYPPDKISPRIVESDLQHLVGADQHRVYFLAAVLGYLLRRVHPQTRWPSDFRTTMSKFPEGLSVTPVNSMGFVESWRTLDLWRP